METDSTENNNDIPQRYVDAGSAETIVVAALQIGRSPRAMAKRLVPVVARMIAHNRKCLELQEAMLHQLQNGEVLAEYTRVPVPLSNLWCVVSDLHDVVRDNSAVVLRDIVHGLTYAFGEEPEDEKWIKEVLTALLAPELDS